MEPTKKNTGPAILAAALIEDIPEKQPMIFLTADHLIEKVGKFNIEIKKNKIGGVGIWALGYDNGYPELWDLLTDKFSQEQETTLYNNK